MHFKTLTLKETYEYIKLTNKGLNQKTNSLSIFCIWFISNDKNINDLIFKNDSILSKEFYWLFSSILSSPENYIDIIDGLRFIEIQKRLIRTQVVVY